MGKLNPIRGARTPLGRSVRRLARIGALAEGTGMPVAEAAARHDELERVARLGSLERRDRREFLKRSGMAALGVALGARTIPSFAALSGDPEVAVVGGGLAGLRAAHALLDSSPTTDVRVYEGGSRLGGRCYTNRGFFDDNLHAEQGGQFIDTEHTAIQGLCRSLNLPLEELWGGGRREETYLLNGRHVKAAAMQDEWVNAQHYRVFRQARRDAPWPPLYDGHNSEHRRLDNLTVNEWLDDVGIGASTDFGQLMQSTHVAEYGLSGDEGSALNLIYILAWNGTSLAPLSGADAAFQIEGGNDRLVSTLSDALGEQRIELERKLIAIEGGASGPYTLRFADGSEVNAPKVILAVPHTTLRQVEIDSRIRSEFSPAKRRMVAELGMAQSNKIQIQFDRKFYLERFTSPQGFPIRPDGTVYTSPGEAGVNCAWDETVGQRQLNPSTRGIMICFPGSDRAHAMLTRGLNVAARQQDVSAFVSQLEEAIPGAVASLTGGGNSAEWRALASNWNRNRWSRGAYAAYHPGQWTSMSGAGAEVVGGNLHFAGEWTDVENGGYLEGAVASGERAAREVWQSP